MADPRTSYDPEDERLEAEERAAIRDEGGGSNGTGLHVNAVLRLEHPTDLGNARRFALHHREHVLYCGALRGWHVWDGQRFQLDDDGAVVRLAAQTVGTIWEEITLTADSREREDLARHARRSENAARIAAMLQLAQAQPELAARPESFDTDPWLLNVLNGTLELRTGTLRKHRRADRITMLAPVVFDPNATAPRWIEFLDRVLPDPAVRGYVQRAVGYSLTGATVEQVVHLPYGAGANGKSVLLETVRAVLGDYARQAEFSTFLVRDHDAIRNDVARLRGARFVSATEAAEGRRLAEALVKQVSGGDMVVARFLHHEHFEFRPKFKLFLAANHKPVIKGTDDAIWRRLRLVPFTVTIPPKERDPRLADALRETELSGILRWAVDGCLAWQGDGLAPPDAVLVANREYREESDVLAGFLADCCVLEPQRTCGAAELYARYTHWCSTTGEKPETQRGFGTRLTGRGIGREKDGGGRIVRRGLALRGSP